MPKPSLPKRRWHVLAIAAGISTALLAVMWGASFRRLIVYVYPTADGGQLSVKASMGIVHASEFPRPVYAQNGWIYGRPADRRVFWLPLWYRGQGPGWTVGVPLWIPTAASLLAAATLWRTDTLHRRRFRTNLCPACTYNRAGLPAASPCPECGTAPAPVAASSR